MIGNINGFQLSLAKILLTVKQHLEKISQGNLIKYWYEIERVKYCTLSLPHKIVSFKYQHDLAYVNMSLSTWDEFWWNVINMKLFRHKLDNRIIIGCAKRHIFPDETTITNVRNWSLMHSLFPNDDIFIIAGHGVYTE